MEQLALTPLANSCLLKFKQKFKLKSQIHQQITVVLNEIIDNRWNVHVCGLQCVCMYITFITAITIMSALNTSQMNDQHNLQNDYYCL